jgi:hypothetical protein
MILDGRPLLMLKLKLLISSRFCFYYSYHVQEKKNSSPFMRKNIDSCKTKKF